MFEVQIRHIDGESVHVGVLDGQEVWRSVMPTDVSDEVRLNLDHPEATFYGEGE